MCFEIISLICWIVTFICFYIILNPNIDIIKNLHISPYKKLNNRSKSNTLNIIDDNMLIKKSKLFHCNYNIGVFNLNGSLNVGNIMRSGCVFGVKTFHIFGKKYYDSRSCVGSNNYVNLKIINDIIYDLPDKAIRPKINIKKFRDYLIENNLNPIFIEQGGKDLNKFNFNSHICDNPIFIFGNESYGIDLEIINECKDIKGFACISIPQIGVLRSMNVSTSASIILWEYYKQKLIKTDPRYKYDLQNNCEF